MLSAFWLLATGNCLAQMAHNIPKHELRAVWLTTLNGLDWPDTRAAGVQAAERQKRELTTILDRLKAANFNAVVLQTRIRGTVIYPSQIEPWDACLTGHIGQSPGYDPLAYAIEECHKRNMQLHAWVVAIPGNKTAQLKASAHRPSTAASRTSPSKPARATCSTRECRKRQIISPPSARR